MRQTHTYSIMQVTPDSYVEIRTKLVDAGYTDLIHDEPDEEVIDMHGLAIQAETLTHSTPYRFLTDVLKEFTRAEEMHAPLNSLHEAYAVLYEEMDELWEEVRLKHGQRNSVRQYEELIQVAAMCMRTVVNLKLDPYPAT